MGSVADEASFPGQSSSGPAQARSREAVEVGGWKPRGFPFESLWIRVGTPPGALGEGPRKEESRTGRRPSEAEGLGQGSSVPRPSCRGVAERVQGWLFTAGHEPYLAT